jgi:hypothetical protein
LPKVPKDQHSSEEDLGLGLVGDDCVTDEVHGPSSEGYAHT